MGISPEFGFFRLGTEQAGNLHTWQTGVTMQADRVREGIEAARGHDDAAREASLRLDADAHFLLVAARSGMRFAERVQAVTKDERLAEAMAAFAEAFPDTTDLRDVLTHIDECVLNQGHLQPGGRSRRKGEVQDGSFSIRAYTNDGDVVVAFGPFAVKLLAVADAAQRVLNLTAEAWQRGIQHGVDGLGAAEAKIEATELNLLALIDEHEKAERLGLADEAAELAEQVRGAQTALANLVEADDPARAVRLLEDAAAR